MNRTCPDCGIGLEDDEQFCGNCGCYLDWTDQPETGAAPEPVAAPAAPSQPTHPPPSMPPPPPPHPAQDLVARQQPAPQQPAPQQPRAQQPGAPARPPVRVAKVTEVLQPGDLVCGTCGIGNKPSRKFCRRCGTDLAEAVVAKVPWWRRLLRSRGPRVTEAGTRPRAPRGRRRFPTPVAVIGVVVLALVVGGFLLRSQVVDGVDVVRDGVQGTARYVPEQVAASSAQPGHGARLVKDGTENKYWAPVARGPGRGEYVEVTFDDPVRLVTVLVTPGVSATDEEAFLRAGRPAELEAQISTADGRLETETLAFEDKRGAVEFSLRATDVERVRFVIVDAYAGTVSGSRTAIAEIEFWVRR